MNPTMRYGQAGVRRGGIELRQTFTNFQDLWNYIFLPAIFLIVMYFLRGKTVPARASPSVATTIPSVFGMQIVFAGLIMVATILFMEREDGTLLRGQGDAQRDDGLPRRQDRPDLRDVAGLGGDRPDPRRALFGGLRLGSPGAWFTLIWVLLLGLVATMPIGAVLGSLFSSPSSLGFVFVPMMGLIAISGIFYP